MFWHLFVQNAIVIKRVLEQDRIVDWIYALGALIGFAFWVWVWAWIVMD
jgi:hypothetical protein